MSAPRVAVIGCGYMGSLHAAKLAGLAAEGGVRFAGAADLDLARAEAAAVPHGAPAYGDFRALLPHADAAVIAVPTVRHFEVVSAVLDAGLDVLVEKPIAASLPEAEKLLALAARARADRPGRSPRVVQRRGPEGAQLDPRDALRRGAPAGSLPGTRDRRRRGARSHDPRPRHRAAAARRGARAHRRDRRAGALGEIDIANARLHYPGGCQANFTASRVSPTPTRKVRFFQPDGYFSIDFIAQSVVIARRVRDAETGERRVDIQTPRDRPRRRADAAAARLRRRRSARREVARRRGRGGARRAAHGAARGRRDAAPRAAR